MNTINNFCENCGVAEHPGLCGVCSRKRDQEELIKLRSELACYKHESCPCLHTTPCHPDCTCVNPFMSRGCRWCCSYGSPEQRQEQAKYLSSILSKNTKIIDAAFFALGWNHDGCADCEPQRQFHTGSLYHEVNCGFWENVKEFYSLIGRDDLVNKETAEQVAGPGYKKMSFNESRPSQLKEKSKDLTDNDAKLDAVGAFLDTVEVKDRGPTVSWCAKHKENKGGVMNCLVCGMEEMSAALSQIDYLVGKPNDMKVSDYDVYCDPGLVVKNVKSKIDKLK